MRGGEDKHSQVHGPSNDACSQDGVISMIDPVTGHISFGHLLKVLSS